MKDYEGQYEKESNKRARLGDLKHNPEYVFWLEAKLSEREWVSVEERLPKFNQDVLLYDNWSDDIKSMRVGHLSEINTYQCKDHQCTIPTWCGGSDYYNITHWMPLPDKPNAK